MTLPGKVTDHEINARLPHEVEPELEAAPVCAADPVIETDPSLEPGPVRAHLHLRVHRGIAVFAYSAAYPLLGIALWLGASQGRWVGATFLVALSVVTSFLGWALLAYSDADPCRTGSSDEESEGSSAGVFVALYGRTGAIVIVLASYTVAATTHGWPIPHTVLGWFALAWLPLFVAFTLPVRSAMPSRHADQRPRSSI